MSDLLTKAKELAQLLGVNPPKEPREFQASEFDADPVPIDMPVHDVNPPSHIPASEFNVEPVPLDMPEQSVYPAGEEIPAEAFTPADMRPTPLDMEGKVIPHTSEMWKTARSEEIAGNPEVANDLYKQMAGDARLSREQQAAVARAIERTQPALPEFGPEDPLYSVPSGDEPLGQFSGVAQPSQLDQAASAEAETARDMVRFQTYANSPMPAKSAQEDKATEAEVDQIMDIYQKEGLIKGQGSLAAAQVYGDGVDSLRAAKDEIMAAYRQHKSRSEALDAQIAAGAIDPAALWNDKSLFEKATIGISSGLFRFLQVTGTGTVSGANPVMQVLDNAIARDIQGQVANLDSLFKQRQNVDQDFARDIDLVDAKRLLEAEQTKYKIGAIEAFVNAQLQAEIQPFKDRAAAQALAQELESKRLKAEADLEEVRSRIAKNRAKAAAAGDRAGGGYIKVPKGSFGSRDLVMLDDKGNEVPLAAIMEDDINRRKDLSAVVNAASGLTRISLGLQQVPDDVMDRIIATGAVDPAFEAVVSRMQELLLAHTDKLSGVLTDKDMEILRKASGAKAADFFRLYRKERLNVILANAEKAILGQVKTELGAIPEFRGRGVRFVKPTSPGYYSLDLGRQDLPESDQGKDGVARGQNVSRTLAKEKEAGPLAAFSDLATRFSTSAKAMSQGDYQSAARLWRRLSPEDRSSLASTYAEMAKKSPKSKEVRDQLKFVTEMKNKGGAGPDFLRAAEQELQRLREKTGDLRETLD